MTFCSGPETSSKKFLYGNSTPLKVVVLAGDIFSNKSSNSYKREIIYIYKYKAEHLEMGGSASNNRTFSNGCFPLLKGLILVGIFALSSVSLFTFSGVTFTFNENTARYKRTGKFLPFILAVTYWVNWTAPYCSLWRRFCNAANTVLHFIAT